MKRNYSKFIAIVCGLICMCGLSSCCALMDIYGPPPPHHHHHCPPPPPRHHHHHHYRYYGSIELGTTDAYDMAVVDTSNEQSCSVL